MGNATEVLCFDEWYKEAKKLNEDGFSAKDFFEAGQQSKQAEIDHLQKRINLALDKSEDFYDFGDGESSMAFCNDIINTLKGRTN